MANVVVIYGSVRDGRRGIGVARFIQKQLEKRGHTVTLIDPQEYELPLLEKMYMEYDKAPEKMEAIHNALEAAEGIVVVSAEYNHSVPAALKNILDHFQREFYFKPAGIVTYSKGPFGGVRASGQLRIILGELGMVTPSSMFAVSSIDSAMNEDGTAKDENYNRRVQRFLDELDWYMNALTPAREKGLPF